MTKVFVHGVPETADVWALLLEELARLGIDDVRTLSPPGFGAPADPDFTATPDAYVRWLIEELEEVGPVDIVGHDWGAGHVFGLLVARPDLVRSWAADVAGLVHPDYTWHDAAQAWQRADVGEQVIEVMVGQDVSERQAAYEELGLPPRIAAPMAAALNEEMGRCILALYRGGAQPYLAHTGRSLAAAELPPGLVIDPSADPYVPSAMSREVASSVGAGVLRLDGQGHWWMSAAAAPAAAGLRDFWRT